jgi:methylenetetrahydrofolate--tRNA-(uracil-5-)-methyltransferase
VTVGAEEGGHPDGGQPVRVLGAGLAGCEAAWQLAQRGISVHLYEMRPVRMTPAHTGDRCAELVCSNSLRSDNPELSAVGLLHEEMRQLGSLVLTVADQCRLPAGSALAVDRDGFAARMTACMEQHPRITLIRQEVTQLDRAALADTWTIIATGPLTSDAFSTWLQEQLGHEHLAFFDAIAPIIALESIDFGVAWRQSRYDKGDGADYINCPLDRDGYERFIDALVGSDKVALRAFERVDYFDGCLPIEVMAERGRETLRYGPMKPVGLRNPHTGGTPVHAVVQLRQDNAEGTLWNMVGFQTRMTWPEQQRLFRTIPGLEQAEFYRMGALHRNTFINGPHLLTPHMQWRDEPTVLFAGQMTGVEGYVESAATGWLAGTLLAERLLRQQFPGLPPRTTAHGALLHHITTPPLSGTFQPMNINFGLLPSPPPGIGKKQRRPFMARRALEDLAAWQRILEA